MKTQIKKDIMVAMRNKDTVTRDVLRVVLGEIDRNPPGADVLQIIKKMVTNITEIGGSIEEIKILSQYLPKELSRPELEQIIDQYIIDENLEGMRSLGVIMKHMTQTYPNQYDGKLVSQIAKEVLL